MRHFLRFIILISLSISISQAQQIQPSGDMFSKKQQLYVLRNVNSNTIKNQAKLDTIKVDTILAGEYYKFQFRIADNNSKVKFTANGLPIGFNLNENGIFNGITDDGGTYYIPFEITDGYNISSGVIQMIVKRSNFPIDKKISESFDVYPNKFNKTVNLEYILDKSYTVSIKIFNKQGEVVRVISYGEQQAGDKKIAWDGKDGMGNRLNDGWYFLQFNVYQNNNYIFSEMRKMKKKTRDDVSFWD